MFLNCTIDDDDDIVHVIESSRIYRILSCRLNDEISIRCLLKYRVDVAIPLTKYR